MKGSLVNDVLAALEDVAQKHRLIWDSVYIDFRNCPDEMLATHYNDAKSKKMADKLVANLRFWRPRKKRSPQEGGTS